MKVTVYLSLEQLLRLHQMQFRAFGGSAGLRDRAGLEATAARPLKWVLALAAVQLCAWGVVATLISGCETTSRTNDVVVNNPPIISGMSASPTAIRIGDSSNITASVRENDFAIVSWTLTVDPASSGTFVPDRGSVDFRGGQAAGSIDSVFTAARAGRATIRASADDGQGGVTTAMVEITVTAREGGV